MITRLLRRLADAALWAAYHALLAENMRLRLELLIARDLAAPPPPDVAALVDGPPPYLTRFALPGYAPYTSQEAHKWTN